VAAALGVWGLPTVDLHGPLHRYLGIMDPLCGGTRAAYFTVRGQWSTAAYYNPIGPVAVVGAALMVLRAAVGFVTGRWLTVEVAMRRRAVLAVTAPAVVAFVALAARQQLIADVLR
jgi:hypothetical protein